ncbi:tRNA uridine-5-carboxymethylaminomethyl(34) synthesis GTPase MnmE [Aureimonas jatrophae]|uniref:tRNA uridine-5-carboxymethylaminomethyl(34) synthesis GTPase MnmE n=1 Tax=Aureimonas jatrophae TaxID=1166073 RepID=UPI000B83F9E5|nr:tRNA uridine-5-carboxymethylaminomethyl(34) synthesis GTPase MnmE [Aureimonas jatrophae]MBB3950975.1 tRNA modification GTPase [Aureimonas jatrophae]
MTLDDTIAALSSGPLPAGIAVLRLSGGRVRAALEQLAGGVPEARRATLRTFRDVAGEPIDRGLLLFFPGPTSVTGEDLAEFHLHGGRAVVAAMLSALTALPDIRLAEAGEFTRRAFANGRIDLTEAEGLADLLAAETETQRRRAFRQSAGEFRDLAEGWARRLLRARALIEAEFDFSDEGDVGESAARGVRSEVEALRVDIERRLRGARRGEIGREGFRVAIAGAPNAGKSSLLNALSAREAAIVSPEAGTTRDLVEVRLDLGGAVVILTDTAGLRETDGLVERIGIERARAAIGEADLVLSLAEPGHAFEALDTQAPVWPLRTKADLALPHGEPALSTATGLGLDTLLERISNAAREAAGDPAEVVPTRERHRLVLAETAAILAAYDPEHQPPEVAAETLRLAADRLGSLTGRTGVEDLLGVIFSEFCVGK